MAIADVDYLIIGAGLAGLTTHKILEGASVAILDPHPARHKLGESVAPNHFQDPVLAPLLAEARRLPSYSPKRGVIYIGADSVAAFPTPPHDWARAMHLRREELETLMMSLWGTPVETERVTDVDLDAALVRTRNRAWRVRRQIIDCSGPARVVARHRADDVELWPSYSSWMYYDVRDVIDVRFPEFLHRTGRPYARFDTGVGRRLSSGEEYEGWAPSDCTVVTRVCDGMFAWTIPLYQRSIISFGVTSRHGPISRTDLKEIARSCMSPCYEVSARPFDGSSAYNRYHVFNHFSRNATEVASERWVLIGDAATFGEPIYATGTSVAVTQALFVGRAIQDGGWTRAKADDYTARCRRLVETSSEARRYIFQAPASCESAQSSVFVSRGLEGTPFQLTMANNYGLAVAGLKAFDENPEQFGSHSGLREQDFERGVAGVRALLDDEEGGGTEWEVRAAYRTSGGAQIHWSRVDRPDLIVRIEPVAAGQRFFRQCGALGMSLLNLPDRRPYPFTADVAQLLEAVSRSLLAHPEAWHAFVTDRECGRISGGQPGHPERRGTSDPTPESSAPDRPAHARPPLPS